MKEFTKKILFQLNLLVALALLLAYGANFISPARIWPIAFFGLSYPILFLANLFFLIFWLWRVNKKFILSLVIIVVGLSNVGRYIQLPSGNKATETDLKVLTYNVRVFDEYDWASEDVDRDSIARYINSLDADLVCLQEFYVDTRTYKKSETHTKNLFKTVTPHSHIKYSLRRTNTKRKFGVATLSKYPIIRKGSINFENSFNTCIFSDVLYNSDTIRVYNIHLQSISLKKNYTLVDSLAYINSKRIGEMKDISKRLKTAYIRRAEQVEVVKEHVGQSPYPVIICGDFNDTPVSYTYHQLLGDRIDAFREAGSGLSRTYSGDLPSFRIDYIFHDSFFEATDYSIANEKLSDHYPVMSSLQVNSEIENQ